MINWIKSYFLRREIKKRYAEIERLVKEIRHLRTRLLAIGSEL